MRTSRSRRSHGASKPRVSDASKLRVRQGSLGCTRARLAGWRCSAPGAAQVGVVPGGEIRGERARCRPALRDRVGVQALPAPPLAVWT